MTDAWGDLSTWMVHNDLLIDLLTIWCLCLGFMVLGAVEAVSWLTLRGTSDRSGVGRNLKRKKAAWAVLAMAMSALYGLTLVAYYSGYLFGFWERFWLRIVVIGGITCACFYGTRFVRALRHERRTP